MMRFKAGVLGVVVLMVAIVATLMGSWVMSMDVNEVQVIRYNALADISGEFDTEQTPTFTEYNPSTNYTGYYTDGSVISGQRYFDGVDYTATNPNNFRIQEAPTAMTASTETLPDSGGSSSQYTIYVRTTEDSRQVSANVFTLKDLIDSWDLDDYNRIVMTNPDSSIDWYDYSDIEGSWVAFLPKAWVQESLDQFIIPVIVFKNPDIPESEVLKMPSDIGFIPRDPTMAAVYSSVSNTIQIYYDNGMTSSAGIYTPEDVYVICGSRDSSADYLHLGLELDVAAYLMPNPTYMDPSAGVMLE